MSSETTSSYPPARPGFGRRLALAFGRFLKALLKVALVIAIIIAMGYGAYLIVQELQRSFQTVSGRVDYNLEQVQRIGHDLGALEQTVTAVQTAQDTRLTALETTVNTTLSDDLARQEEMLVALELQLSHLATQTITINEQIVSLNEGVVALQGDINENNGRLDELGGQLDTQANNSRELATQVTDLQTAVDALPLADIEQMRQVVTLFRVWEMVGRARLHLLDRQMIDPEDYKNIVIKNLPNGDIVRGGDDSATTYLRGRTETRLTALLKPPMTRALTESGAFTLLRSALREVGLASITTIDFSTTKALDGCFYFVAEEERAIRRDPWRRTTDILRRVFG
ncbi:MAG TPA: DUF4197 family protein [Chloroflexota bacterium]|nr:DUF4197 family protein [Chloroflexota bacterium]